MIDAHCHLQASAIFPTRRKQILADFDKTLRSKMLRLVESDPLLLENASLNKTMRTLAEIFKLDIESLEMRIEENLERVFPEVKNDRNI